MSTRTALCVLALAVAEWLLAPTPAPDAPKQAIVWGPIIAAVAPAIVSGIASILSRRSANSASREAQASQERSNQEALDFERERELRRAEEWKQTQDANERMWRDEVTREQANTDRAFNEDVFRDRRLDPYREAGRAALADLNARRQGSMRDLMPIGRI